MIFLLWIVITTTTMGGGPAVKMKRKKTRLILCFPPTLTLPIRQALAGDCVRVLGEKLRALAGEEEALSALRWV